MRTKAEQGLVDASLRGQNGHGMREVALTLVAAGWPVFPCGQDKAPLVPGGFKARTTNSQQVEQWWALHPDAMPAICPGDNGLAAIDVDSAQAWQRAEAAGISCYHGLIVESGGTSKPFLPSAYDGEQTPRHIYVRAAVTPKIAGVVVRFLAGYVIAPGARRGTRVYRVIADIGPGDWNGETEAQQS